MGILDVILGRNHGAEINSSKEFGRYSDSEKSNDKYDHWDAALKAYEQGLHLDNFTHVLEFLKDDTKGNLQYSENKGVITFHFYQGSKIINGTADRNKLRAESKIAITHGLELGFTRSLIEQNFDLQYCRFALNENDDISIVFDTYAVDASPYKVYYAFKELAAMADKHDDILLVEYDSLSRVGDQHIAKVSQSIKDIKYDFIYSRIAQLVDLIDSGKINIQKYPVGLSYLIIDLAYKIDYLIKPEGYTKELVEEIHQTFLQSKSEEIHAKNQKVVQELKSWLERPRKDFDEEIYDVISTFGITMPSGHDKLSECIDSELPKSDWYYENQYDDVALAIPSYLVGYLMYSYALPSPDRDLLHLIYEIIEADFFAKMSYPNNYWKKGKLNVAKIKKRIKNIAESHQEKYPKIRVDIDSINFDDVCIFCKTYMQMISKLDMFERDIRNQ